MRASLLFLVMAGNVGGHLWYNHSMMHALTPYSGSLQHFSNFLPDGQIVTAISFSQKMASQAEKVIREIKGKWPVLLRSNLSGSPLQHCSVPLRRHEMRIFVAAEI